MTNWLMLTVIGRDQAGIVAKVSKALLAAECHLGEASMIRLGGNFTMMLMVKPQKTDTSTQTIKDALNGIRDELDLRVHVDPVDAALHQHLNANVQITVFGADRAGIVARVTQALFEQKVHIIDLSSDVGGSDEKPFYIMRIEGCSDADAETLRQALAGLSSEGIDVKVTDIDTLIG